MFGIRVDVHHHLGSGPGPILDKLDALEGAISNLKQEVHDMGAKTDAAVAELVAEAQDSKGKLATLVTTVRGFPALVAAAVADAIANLDLGDEERATLIRTATADISGAVDEAFAAAEVNPLPGDDTSAGGGEDTLVGGGEGEDTLAGGGEDVDPDAPHEGDDEG